MFNQNQKVSNVMYITYIYISSNNHFLTSPPFDDDASHIIK